MNFSKFLTTTYSFKLTGAEVSGFLALLIVLLLISGLFVGRTLVIRIKERDEIKTGFLGKPLLQFVGVFVMLGAIGGAVYLAQKPANFVSQAEKKVEVKVEYTTQSIGNNQTRVTLNAIPVIDSVNWGEEGKQFDIIWDIKTDNGLINSNKKELFTAEASKTAANPSGISFVAKPGVYNIKVIITFNEGSFDQEISIKI